MTEKLRGAIEETGERLRKEWDRRGDYAPKLYRSKKGIGRRDVPMVGGLVVLSGVAYYAHDIRGVTLPSPETMAFVGTLFGLWWGRRFRR